MKLRDKDEPQKLHMRCVVCGRSFCSLFDEDLRAFKYFHTEPSKESAMTCEDKLYKELIRIYAHLHKLQNSITMNQLVKDFDWLGLVMMKKEMLKWCMERGFLTVDNFMRVETPPKVIDECSDLFETLNLMDDEKLDQAFQIVKEILETMIKRGELEPVPEEDIPIKEGEIDFGPSKLYKNIDTSETELKRDKPGMATTGRTGARDVHKRMSAASSTMERRRMDQKDKKK